VALPAPARVAWIAACALVGLPALVALWLLYPLRERLDALPSRMGQRLATALLLCAAGVGPATAAPPPVTEAGDAASLQALAAAERARPRAPRLPREAFLAQRMLREARLSPDGRSVVALVENGRDRSLWLADEAHPRGRRLLARSSAEDMYFSHDGRWLFLVSPTQLYALAMAGQPGSGAIAQVGELQHREFAGVDPWRPAAVLVLQKPPRITALPKRWRLWRVEAGGRTSLVHESRLDIVDFAFAPDGSLSHLRLASREMHAIVHREGPDALGKERWRALAVCKESRQCSFVGTANGGRDLLMDSNLGGDLQRLMRLDAGGGLHALHADPRGIADLAEVVLDPADNVPVIAAYRSTVVSNQALRPDLQAPLAALSQRFPQAQLRLEVARGARTAWLLREGGDAMRGERLHLYAPDSGRSVELLPDLAYQSKGKPAPRLPEAAMARQVPVSWTASDGLRLHGFLLLPPGADPKHTPLVVSVHGGPFNQVKPGFNTRSQFLANRGYIVFSPNFRASTGYGRNYVLSSAGDFGGDGRVQRDIVEGTRWLLANGIGDPARVGIVGASYGGYATLLGLSFQPDLFKVGVASVPPSDFAFVMREYLGAAKEFTPGVSMAATMRHLGIDPHVRVLMAKLHAQSPVVNVSRMRRPLLLLAGGEDDRIPIRGVTDYAARLKLLQRDVSLFVDTEAGHNLVDPRTREAYLYLEETLLHRHLGGVAPEPASGELLAHIKRNLRLRGPSLATAAVRL
jgi:dienelactone hydrolase